MQLTTLDWIIIAAFFAVSLLIGILSARKSGKSAKEFFLSGRNMPWWLLGISMVATTFSADTPNLVTQFVREDGVAANWQWWAFLLTGMLTVFVYARLWRRSGVLTDIEFYELRYSGKPAAFLRGFRALYLGVFFNIVIMATVCVAAIKLGGILLGVPAWQTLTMVSVVTVAYSALGGLRGVIITDFVQFALAMVGSVAAAIYLIDLPEVGGLTALISAPEVSDKLRLIPDVDNIDLFVAVFLIPIAVQWWSVWYPGAEPGGGGYIAQRMLSAKNENHAVGATLLFNLAHYALRPWPWILIALASLIVFPDVASLEAAFSAQEGVKIDNDLAYPAMLSYLPAGLLGLVVASLIAALMSTLSTHLNWGSSYVVNDFYLRFIKPDASERRQVAVGRISTVLLMLIAAVLSLFIESAGDGFQALLQIGAGTGLIFILRWFWWRINAYTELAGMMVSFIYAIAILLIEPDWPKWMTLLIGVGVTTAGWLIVTFVTPSTDVDRLRDFYMKIRPSGKGWKRKLGADIPPAQDGLPEQLLFFFFGTIIVYAALFGTGALLYGQHLTALSLWITAVGLTLLLFVRWKNRKTADQS